MGQEEDQGKMYICLRTIFERAHEFGGGLFALGASVMTDLIHHEPTIFTALEENGLPEAFVNSVKVSPLWFTPFAISHGIC